LAAIIEKFRLKGNVDEPLQALILTHYNPFRGEVIFRVINGELRAKRLNSWLLEMNIS
jgi:hypothetical protein